MPSYSVVVGLAILRTLWTSIHDCIFSFYSPILRFVAYFQIESLSAAALRRELSDRSRHRGTTIPHELSYGAVPSVIFQEFDGAHGNFHPESYTEIQARPRWVARLRKAYAAGQWIPRRWDRERCELDCANSSDALLMNIFCYPAILNASAVCTLLGVSREAQPEFGFKPRIPVVNQRTGHINADQTEVDMALEDLLIEAKLTESGFQTAPLKRALRYCGIHEAFDIDHLPTSAGAIQSYQLVRGVLAALHLQRQFVVLCDARRVDLIDKWFLVMRAVRCCELRSRLALVTWQELAAAVPADLQSFLKEKYGIIANSSRPTP